jgi:hypothetical protein
MGVLKNSTNLNLYMCVLNVDGVLIFVRAEFLYFSVFGACAIDTLLLLFVVGVTNG